MVWDLNKIDPPENELIELTDKSMNTLVEMSSVTSVPTSRALDSGKANIVKVSLNTGDRANSLIERRRASLYFRN